MIKQGRWTPLDYRQSEMGHLTDAGAFNLWWNMCLDCDAANGKQKTLGDALRSGLAGGLFNRDLTVRDAVIRIVGEQMELAL